MIKWYDYVAAFIAADFMTGFIFSGNIIGAILAGFVYHAWINFYCNWRKTHVDD